MVVAPGKHPTSVSARGRFRLQIYESSRGSWRRLPDDMSKFRYVFADSPFIDVLSEVSVVPYRDTFVVPGGQVGGGLDTDTHIITGQVGTRE